MRLFVGAEVPALPPVALPEGVRPVPPEKLHVTLFFLGERDDVDACRAALPAPRPGRLRTGGLAWFGSALALEVHDLDGALAAVHARGFPGWRPEPRPFRPHVTVGRARRGARRPPLPAAPPAVGFALTALVLWASRGGRYEALQRAEIAL